MRGGKGLVIDYHRPHDFRARIEADSELADPSNRSWIFGLRCRPLNRFLKLLGLLSSLDSRNVSFPDGEGDGLLDEDGAFMRSCASVNDDLPFHFRSIRSAVHFSRRKIAAGSGHGVIAVRRYPIDPIDVVVEVGSRRGRDADLFGAIEMALEKVMLRSHGLVGNVYCGKKILGVLRAKIAQAHRRHKPVVVFLDEFAK